MPYIKTDKTYAHEKKSYVVYKGGSNGNTRFIRLNRKFTSVPSLQSKKLIKGGGGEEWKLHLSGTYTPLHTITHLKNALKELKPKFRKEFGEGFRFMYCQRQPNYKRFRNPCKTKGLPIFSTWVPELHNILNNFKFNDNRFTDEVIRGKALINFVKYDAFWEILEDVSNK